MLILLLLHAKSVFSAYNDSYPAGSMKGLYSYSEALAYLALLESTFPEYVLPPQVSNSSIGRSYHREAVFSMDLTAPNGPKAKERMLVTAGHSATSPVATSFVIYVIRKLLDMRDDPLVSYLLAVIRFSFVPVVNPDALQAQSAYFKGGNGSFGSFATNANATACTRYFLCSSKESGVNLNRNYGYMWGVDDIGSSNQPCDPQYRGVSPFSELETIAVATLLMQAKVSMAVNYEGMGNYYLRPVMYANDSDKAAYSAAFQRSFYEGIGKDGGFPEGAKVGTMEAVLKKRANGALIDWLYSKDIPAYEVALGLASTGNELNSADLQQIYDAHWSGFLAIAKRATTYPRYETTQNPLCCTSRNQLHSPKLP